jgi:hypothetical protein
MPQKFQEDGLAGTDESLAFFVGTDAQNGERPAFRHATPPQHARIERGLYSGLPRGIQESQKRRDALRPGCFVVLRAFDALVVQVLAGLPAFL